MVASTTSEVTTLVARPPPPPKRGPPPGAPGPRAASAYARFYKDVMGLAGVVGHDLLAVTYALRPDWFGTRSGPICVLCDGIGID